MSQKAREILFAVGLLAVCSLVAIPAVAQKSPAVPQAIPVNVENTPNVNVANTASVNVANTPSVSVTNTPSVNVANSPTVTLESGASVAVTSPLDGQGNPTPVAVLDAVQPYEDTCSISLPGYYIGTCNFQALPSGKMLVVQEFDGVASLDVGTKPTNTVFYVNQSETIGHFLVAFYQGTQFGLDQYAIHQETRIYVAEGQTPQCYVVLSSIGVSPAAGMACNISGYLVDVPAGGFGVLSRSQQHQRLPRNPLPGRQPNNSGH